MNNIVTPTGEYIKTVFVKPFETDDTHAQGIDRVWKLIGSRNNKDPKKWKAINAVDEFRCIQTGEYLEAVREQIYNLAELGKIK